MDFIIVPCSLFLPLFMPFALCFAVHPTREYISVSLVLSLAVGLGHWNISRPNIRRLELSLHSWSCPLDWFHFHKKTKPGWSKENDIHGAELNPVYILEPRSAEHKLDQLISRQCRQVCKNNRYFNLELLAAEHYYGNRQMIVFKTGDHLGCL